MTKTSQDNNFNYINLKKKLNTFKFRFKFKKHFYEYHTEKLKYRYVTCLILKVLPWWICYYCFCSHIQSLVELGSVIVVTAPYIEHTAPLTYSLCIWPNTTILYNIGLFKTVTIFNIRNKTLKITKLIWCRH